MKKIKNKISYETLIIILGVICGLLGIIFFGDRSLENEWQIMVKNLDDYKILSSRQINGEWVPNLFMPPLYPIFLYCIKKIFFFASIHYVNIILLIQLILYMSSVIIFKKILCEIFKNKKTITLGLLILAFFPLNIYAVSQISSIGLQLFLFIIFIYYFVKIYKYFKKLDLFFFSVVSGLLILLRGEFFVFYFFSLFYFFIKTRRFLLTISSILITLIILSPYLIRNYYTFEVIALTKSTGFNLLKGNNPKSKVEGVGMWYGYDVVPQTATKLKEISSIKNYDLISDKIFLDYAIKFIIEDTSRYIMLYIKKFLSFILIDIESSYPGYYSLLNIIPKILISIFTLFSMSYFFSLKVNVINYFSLLYILNAFLFSFFFILPRYTLSVLPLQIIICLFLYEKFLKKKKI